MSPSQQQTAIGFFQKLSNHDYDGIASSFSDKFEHAFLPASLGGLGQATRDKNQFLQFLKDTERLIASFNFKPPLEVIDGEDVVVIHIVADGKTTVTQSPFNNEYLAIFRFDGEKIVSLKEFMDSKYATDMTARERAASNKEAEA